MLARELIALNWPVMELLVRELLARKLLNRKLLLDNVLVCNVGSHVLLLLEMLLVVSSRNAVELD